MEVFVLSLPSKNFFGLCRRSNQFRWVAIATVTVNYRHFFTCNGFRYIDHFLNRMADTGTEVTSERGLVLA